MGRGATIATIWGGLGFIKTPGGREGSPHPPPARRGTPSRGTPKKSLLSHFRHFEPKPIVEPLAWDPPLPPPNKVLRTQWGEGSSDFKKEPRGGCKHLGAAISTAERQFDHQHGWQRRREGQVLRRWGFFTQTKGQIRDAAWGLAIEGESA